MRQLKHLFTAAVMLFAVTACDEGSSTTDTQDINGTISGVVTAEGAAVVGAEVSISGGDIPIQQVGATDGSGEFSFTGLSTGTFTITVGNVEGVTFATASKSVTLSASTKSGAVAFAGEYIRTSSITGTVTIDGQGAAGIGVNLTGTEDRAATTDGSGAYSFSGLKAGTYTVTINPPTGTNFPVTSQSVTIGSGATEVISFDGERPLTATVAIKSITQGMTNTPVNPANVFGQIDVTVLVNDPQNQIRQLTVLVDGEACAGCTQGFQAPSEGASPDAAPSGEYVFTILTNGLNEDGSINYGNGVREITVEGETSSADKTTATSVDLTFNNADTWVVLSAGAPAGPVVGQDANNWWGNGDFTVEASHANYSGATVTSAAAGLTNSTDGAATGALDGSIWTFVFDDPETTAMAGSVLSLSGVLDAGGSVTFTGNTYFLDQTGPAGGIYNLADQSADNPCCSNNWFGADYDHNDGHTLGVDAGVGQEDVAFWAFDAAGFANPAAPTTAEIIAAMEDGYTGDTAGDMGLPPSDQNTDYVMVAEELDGLGNGTFVVLSPSADSPLNGTGGLDIGAPTTGLCTGAGTPNAQCNVASLEDMDVFNIAAPFAGQMFQAFAFDVGTAETGGPSGVPPGSELFGTLQQYLPTATNCVLGVVVNSVCTEVSMAAAPGGVAGDGATGQQGYFEWDAQTRDRAGNFGGGFTEQMILIDVNAPVVTAIFQPQGVLMGGQSPNFISTWTDNLDGSSITHTVDYGFGALMKTGEAAIPDGGFGPPFATSGNINATVAFWIRRLDWSNPHGTSQAAPSVGIENNNLMPLNMTVFLTDAAGNVGTNSSPGLIVEDASTKGIVAANPNVLTYGFRHADELLDISDGDSAVLEVVLTGTLGQVTNPCSRGVQLYLLDDVNYLPSVVQESLAPMTALPAEEDNVERRWRFQYTYAPTTGAPANPTFLALCSSTAGDGLITFNQGITTQP